MQTPSALTGKELSSLSAFELGVMLNEIDEQEATFSQIAIDAERALGDAEEQAILHPDDRSLRASIRKMTRNLKAVDRQLSALSKKQKRIQSLLKSMGPQPQ